ncbi:MAG: glycosyltransferase family 2 protein, partial [Geminocystis sp.]|nr:glycosyltransferase family 2 protein [Geminocystis sp.]
MDLSIVVPIYNEEDNIPILIQSIEESLKDTGYEYEIVCVDDGSQDCSLKILKNLAMVNPRLRVVALRRNYGQTAAMAAGFENSRGQFIVTLDGDLQNDPADIPLLLAKLQEGYDLVSGWRRHRRDDTITRVVPSKVANWLISRITGVAL